MSAETFYIGYLSGALDVPVSGDVPSPRPQRFVTVEQTGSRQDNLVYSATLAVQSWAESREAAAALNERVKTAMIASKASPHVLRCSLSTDYNYPELDTRSPRYQAIFNVIVW